VLDGDHIELLESGCALIIGFVTAGGWPYASRGWGFTIAGDGAPARLLVPECDVVQMSQDDCNLIRSRIAVTGTSVLTYRSVQVKGTITAVEPATAADAERMARYTSAFLKDIEAVDHFPPVVTQRMAPDAIVALELVIDEAYDQTPGPRAGAPVRGRRA
jgi:hypothetical protein